MWARCVERVGEDCVCARAKSDGYADCECSWVPEATKTCKHMSICIINSTRGVVYEVYMQLCACDERVVLASSSSDSDHKQWRTQEIFGGCVEIAVKI